MYGLLGVVLAAYHLRRWQRDRTQAKLVNPIRDPYPLQATPKVSLLVPAWNEAHNLPDHIQSFLELTYPNKELILCAGGTDQSYAVARRCEGNTIHVLEQMAGEGKQQALRRCLEIATGEIIFLTDADCILTNAVFTWTLARSRNPVGK